MGSSLQLVSKPAVIITAVNIAANSIDLFNISFLTTGFRLSPRGRIRRLSHIGEPQPLLISHAGPIVFLHFTPPSEPSLARLERWYPCVMHCC